MHLPASPRRRLVPPFANHTPRPFELQKNTTCPTSAMFGPTGMALGSVLIQQPSQPQTKALDNIDNTSGCSTGDSANHDTSTSSQRVDSHNDDASRPTSPKLSTGNRERNAYIDEMMTQTNLLVLPPSNPSYQMAYFLKTTGPSKEPMRKTSKPNRISSAMRMLKPGKCKIPEALATAHQRYDIDI